MIGRGVEFEVITATGNELRYANIKSVKFDQKLRIPVFTAITPFGNIVKLTRDEIRRFLK